MTRRLSLGVLALVLVVLGRNSASETAVSPSPVPSPTPTCTTVTFDCSECVEYTCFCSTQNSSKPDAEFEVHSLPHNQEVPDPEPGNAQCESTVRGSCNCSGTYSVQFKILPLVHPQCYPKEPGGHQRLKTTMKCRAQDAFCAKQCSKTLQKTCTVCR